MKQTKLTIKRDTNGNKIACFTSCTGRKGFSVQTMGNCCKLHKLPIGETIPAHQRVELWADFLAYIKDYGTDYQKSFFDLTD